MGVDKGLQQPGARGQQPIPAVARSGVSPGILHIYNPNPCFNGNNFSTSVPEFWFVGELVNRSKLTLSSALTFVKSLRRCY